MAGSRPDPCDRSKSQLALCGWGTRLMAKDSSMDLWGHCTACERWFSMAGQTRTCPVCRSEPAVITDRAEEQPAAPSLAEQA